MSLSGEGSVDMSALPEVGQLDDCLREQGAICTSLDGVGAFTGDRPGWCVFLESFPLGHEDKCLYYACKPSEMYAGTKLINGNDPLFELAGDGGVGVETTTISYDGDVIGPNVLNLQRNVQAALDQWAMKNEVPIAEGMEKQRCFELRCAYDETGDKCGEGDSNIGHGCWPMRDQQSCFLNPMATDETYPHPIGYGTTNEPLGLGYLQFPRIRHMYRKHWWIVRTDWSDKPECHEPCA